MNETYSIEIPNDKLSSYRLVTLIVSIINLLAFAYIALNEPPGYAAFVVYFGLALSAGALAAILLKRFGKSLSDIWAATALIACALIWLQADNFLAGLLLIVFAAMSLVAQKKPVIHFDKEQIRYPSFPEKKFSWSAIDFVLLKDDILSIETRDNHLLQFTLDTKVASQVDSNEFNQFCAHCVSKALTETTVR